jgi:hypothetical protein
MGYARMQSPIKLLGHEDQQRSYSHKAHSMVSPLLPNGFQFMLVHHCPVC